MEPKEIYIEITSLRFDTYSFDYILDFAIDLVGQKGIKLSTFNGVPFKKIKPTIAFGDCDSRYEAINRFSKLFELNKKSGIIMSDYFFDAFSFFDAFNISNKDIWQKLRITFIKTSAVTDKELIDLTNHIFDNLPISGELPIYCVNDFEKPEYCSQRNNHLCQKCKDW